MQRVRRAGCSGKEPHAARVCAHAHVCMHARTHPHAHARATTPAPCPQANPSLAEKLYEQFKAKKSSLASATKEDIMGKYGSCAGPLPDDVRALAGTEKYVEYDRLGRVVKGQVGGGWWVVGGGVWEGLSAALFGQGGGCGKEGGKGRAAGGRVAGGR